MLQPGFARARHQNPRPTIPPLESAYPILNLSSNLRPRSPCCPMLAPPPESSTSPADQCSATAAPPPPLPHLSASRALLADSRYSMLMARCNQLEDTLRRQCVAPQCWSLRHCKTCTRHCRHTKIDRKRLLFLLWMHLSWMLRCDWSDIIQ